ncbi:uncharacterized protein LOC131165654 isoform X2 [Malania oleifera]|nr:uncharacterized protein LOC131165654 isoform X2 [Malania oleifera]
MLELARGISHWAHGFKNGVIFLFNTGEEDGLNGAHSFITQHPWSSTVRMAIDLEAMGIGGKSSIFQAGPHPLAIENFAKVAKYPSGQIMSQDIFSSGLIKSATDFQVYKEVAGLSGLDFAYVDKSAVYHTKNDKLKLLKPGSIQHLGENMLAFLLHTASSSQLPDNKAMEANEIERDSAIFFDILGSYMIVYRQNFASMLHNSVIMQSLLIWATSLLMGGYPAMISIVLSCLSLILMWTFSIILSVSVAFILPFISSSPVPYVASPWLVVGLFGAPAVLGALTGQHLGYLILLSYLSRICSNRMQQQQSPVTQTDLIKLEAERWLFKAGFVQWFVLLMIGNYYKIGSSYLALVWLISPAFAYGFLEATLTPARSPKPLKVVTLLMGLTIPVLMSAGIVIRLVATMIGSVVRFDRNPGSFPEWLGNVIMAIIIAVIVCLTIVFLLSYLHLSGAKRSTILAACILFGLSVAAIKSGIIPPFTEDTARAVNVVHIVDTTGSYGEQKDPLSYISLFSATPGKLTKEVEEINEGFVCGRDKVIDFVTFSVNYGCWTDNDTGSGWSKSEAPALHVESDIKGDDRTTQVSIDTKISTRWSLAINTAVIEDFVLEGNSGELVPPGNKGSMDGWHIIQFSGGKNALTRFNLTLSWFKNYTHLIGNISEWKSNEHLLLKLRTDVDRLTEKTERVLTKLPSWCSLFGKSTSPFTLAFLSGLPIVF